MGGDPRKRSDKKTAVINLTTMAIGTCKGWCVVYVWGEGSRIQEHMAKGRGRRTDAVCMLNRLSVLM